MTWLLTLGPVGHMRPAPGTWGSLVAVFLGAGLIQIGGAWALGISMAVLASLSQILLPPYLEATQNKDPSEVVIDEVVGQWVALLPVAVGTAHAGVSVWHLWPGLLVAFLAFRLFDIWKPGPIRWAEKLPGASGVMYDDVLAGVAAALVVMLGAYLSHGVLGL